MFSSVFGTASRMLVLGVAFIGLLSPAPSTKEPGWLARPCGHVQAPGLHGAVSVRLCSATPRLAVDPRA